MRGTSAIVGIGESHYYRPGGASETEFQLACIAIKNAVTDAGLRMGDIDGFVSYASDRNTPTRLATALGVDETRLGALSWDGGGNGVAGTLVLADAAVTAGYANYVVCYRGLAQDMKRPPLEELLLNNVYFDTCVYHQAGIDLLLEVIPADNILFGSEMVGAVRGIDPRTGHHYDDTKRYMDKAKGLSAEDKQKIFSGNVAKVYPRFKKVVSGQG